MFKVSYLTGADLTGITSRMETVPGAVHSALKHTVCKTDRRTLEATLSREEVVRSDPHLPNGAFGVPAHTGQHSPGTLTTLTQGERQRTSEQVVTPSTHMQVKQGVESSNQLLPSACSRPPYIQPLQRGQQAAGSVTWCMQDSLGQSGDAHVTSPPCGTGHRLTLGEETAADAEGHGGRLGPGRCRWSSGPSSGSTSVRRCAPVRPARTLNQEKVKMKQHVVGKQLSVIRADTCALRTTPARLSHRPAAGCGGALQRNAGDGASDAGAALAGVGGGGEGLAVWVDDALV